VNDEIYIFQWNWCVVQWPVIKGSSNPNNEWIIEFVNLHLSLNSPWFDFWRRIGNMWRCARSGWVESMLLNPQPPFLYFLSSLLSQLIWPVALLQRYPMNLETTGGMTGEVCDDEAVRGVHGGLSSRSRVDNFHQRDNFHLTAYYLATLTPKFTLPLRLVSVIQSLPAWKKRA